MRSIIPLTLGAWIFVAGAHAQDYPTKPIRVLGVGGGGGLAARYTSQGISPLLGQPLVLESRTLILTADAAAKAPPDGYTLLMCANSVWIAPLVQKLTWDPVKDFAPVSSIGQSVQLLVVHPALPVKSVKELIALARAHPGQLNYSMGSLGGTTHLGMELFKSMARVSIVGIPYKDNAVATADLIAGRIQVTIDSIAQMMTHVKSGKMKALAITTPRPSPVAPDLPTVASAGLPGFESNQLFVFLVPVRTPVSIIRRLNQEAVRFLATREAKEQFLGIGVEAAGSTPEELAAIMKSEMATLGKLIKDANIRAE